MATASAPTPSSSKPVDTRGLAGQTVGETSVCAVNQTQLIYRGYEIADLAANATFEEVAFLLLIGHKPSAAELAAFKAEVAAMRPIPASVRDAIVRVCKESPKAHPMSILRTGVSLLSHLDPECEDNSPAAELRKAKRLLAQIPTVIGVCQRTLDGQAPVEPDASLSCRVIASTETDMHSAVCGGIGALKGPLHGGANEQAMEMLKDIDRDCAGGKMSVEAWMTRAFAEKRKLMGFGHRVYKNGDHRAGILRREGLKLAEKLGPSAKKWFDLGDEVQAIMLRDKTIHPNVDFPCGMTYFIMGIPVPQYTPIFVASRITGWCAHIMEQHANNRIIRPLADYTGPTDLHWKG